MVAIDSFDFLIGKWSVVNRKLKDRLHDTSAWIEFSARMESFKILNGLGVMDELITDHFGGEFVGLSIRLYNPKSNEWTIYWADTMHPERQLSKQVVGKFEHGVGNFYGTEMFEGIERKLRFIWKKDTINSAEWRQAYYDDNNKKWETNWIMKFTRLED